MLLHGQCHFRQRRSDLYHLVATLFLGQHHLYQCCSASGLLLALSLIDLISQRFLPHGRRLLSPFVCRCRAPTAFRRVLQVGKSSLTLLLPQSLAGKLGVEVAAAKP
jgi:hypothetical protein